MSEKTLYERLGGYDAIQAVAHNLVDRLEADKQLARFWENRGADGIARERQLLIDFLCANAGGPMVYTGRDNATSHKGMGVTASDWEVFMGHLKDTLAHFSVPEAETGDVIAFIDSTRADIVE